MLGGERSGLEAKNGHVTVALLKAQLPTTYSNFIIFKEVGTGASTFTALVFSGVTQELAAPPQW